MPPAGAPDGTRERVIADWGRPHRARLVRLAGWLTVALSLAFLALQLGRIDAFGLIAARWQPLLLVIGGGALAHAAAGFLLAEAWRRLLGGGGSTRAHHAVYGRTQIAKYLPGNCFHFAGRQWLGARLGHGQRALAVASLAETLLLIAIALVLALPLAARWLPPTRWPWLLLAVGAALALAWAGRRSPRLGGWLTVVRAGAGRLATAAVLQLGFFAVCGGLVWLLAGVIATAPLAPATALGAFAVAWVAGLIVPGAAAGIGVREAALTLALAGSIGPEAATAVAVALRLVTTIGDGLFFAAALLLPVPAPPQVAPSAPTSS